MLRLAAVALLLAAPAPLLAQPAVQAPAWAHESSDVRPDPAVRYGRLPNGLRYAILPNKTPPGEASVRLAFDVGSLAEADDERGVAHFLEHLVLNGTKNVPEGEFVRRLERAGLRFGPDTNASTGWDGTVFKLDVPRRDVLGEALYLLREVAGEATLDPAAVDAERPIIQAERRQRDVPQFRASVAQMRHAMAGLTLPDRLPIGTPETIASITADQLRAFYRAHYRPEKATLVVVGDLDPAAVEAEVARLFADWRPQGAPGPDAEVGTLRPPAPVHRYSEAGLPWSVGLTWTRAPDLRPDSEELRRDAIVRSLAIAVFNQRLARIVAEPRPPFISARLSQSPDIADALGSTGVGVVTAPGAWAPALARIEQEVRRYRQFGVADAELKRELAEFRAGYTAAAAGANTRGTRGLAEALVAAATEPQVFTHPRDSLARFEALAPRLTKAVVDAVIPDLFSGNGPAVSLVTPTPVPDGDAAVLAALENSRKVAVTAPTGGAAKQWEYGDWGRPGPVTSRTQLAPDLGVTDVRFANGVRLLVKPTKFDEDQVLVSVGFGRGMPSFPRDVNPVALTSLAPAMSGGGLRAYSAEDLKEVLADRFWGASFGAGEERFSLSGTTRPADLRVQMEVLAAKLEDNGWRPNATNQMRAVADTIHDSMDTQPTAVLAREAARLLTPDDPRDDVPARETLKAVSPQAARRLLAPILARSPLTVTIVGDVDTERAIAEVARTLGALPPRRGPEAPVHPPQFTRIASPTPVVRTHRGGKEQAAALIRWPTTDFWENPRAARTRELLAEILQLRLTDEFRERQGATYGASASASNSTAWPGAGTISASLQAPPDKLPGFIEGTKRIARELAATGPTADELGRVREPALAALRRARTASNSYWLRTVADMADDTRLVDTFATREDDLKTITPADIQAEAKRWLRDDAAWAITVVPEGDPASAGAQPFPASR